MGALVRDRLLRSPKHAAKLLLTAHQPLVHRNAYKDHFWGCGPLAAGGAGASSSGGAGAGEGSNHYGKILMEVCLCERARSREEDGDSDFLLLSILSLLNVRSGPFPP